VAAGLIDELCLHITPVLLGRGERLFEGVGATELTQLDVRHTKLVTQEARRAPACRRRSRSRPQTCQDSRTDDVLDRAGRSWTL
jgi:dihydrofolate reductase